MISDTRLPREVTPHAYNLELQPFLEEGYYKGKVKIGVTWQEPTKEVALHAHQELEISEVVVIQTAPDDEALVKFHLLISSIFIIDQINCRVRFILFLWCNTFLNLEFNIRIACTA